MRKSSKSITSLVVLALVAAAAYYFYNRRTEPRPLPEPAAGKLVIRFLDVGQADSQLLQLPEGQTILIDSGDSGKPTVEMLRSYGVREIDLAIATHPHADHIGEMRDIMRAFKVKEVWDAGFSYPTRTYREMLEEIRNQGVEFKTPRRGESRTFGQTLVEVVHPGPAFISEDRDEANSASIVVRVTFGSNRFLFTGDSEVAAWRQMIETNKDKLSADLLKAAHHGSSNGTTDEVLEAVRPSIVTISCEAGNDYHHPHPRVMRLLGERSSRVRLYRTDLQGTITAVSDGRQIEMSTEKEVATDRLYLTGDEVAGKVASDGRGHGSERPRRGGRRSQ